MAAQMNLLVLCLLVGLCSSHAASVNFYQLCKEDTFQYKGQTVNSVYRISDWNNLAKIGDYAVDEFLDFYDYFKSDTAERLENNKKIYNSRLIDLYSEDLLNSPKFTHDNYRAANGLFEVLDVMRTFRVSGERSSGQMKLNESIAQMEKGWRLAKELMMYKRNYLNPDILTVRDFASLVSEVEPDKLDKMTFANEQISEVYRKSIFQFDEFKLKRYSKLFFDWRSTGSIFYSIYLPANHTGHTGEKPLCYQASGLPAFFRDPNSR